MEKIIVKPIKNKEKIFWISKQEISNTHIGRIYPTQISDVTTSKSVAIYSINELNEKKQIAQLACVDYELLKQKYYAGEFINLNYTYIDDFSWYGTNKLYEVDQSSFKEIKGISACCSFWNAEKLADKLVSLMQLNIMSGDVCFKYAIFYKISFDLTNINILNGNLYFDYVKFWSVDLSLMGISCNRNTYDKATISIDYTEFNNSSVEMFLLKDIASVRFLLSKMNSTKVDINNTMGTLGCIDLMRSKVDKFNMSFCKIGGIDARECEANSLNFKGCQLNGLCEIEIKTKSEVIFNACLLNSILKLDIQQSPIRISFENTINNGRIYFKKFYKIISAVLNSVQITRDTNQLLMLKENFRNLGEYENEDLCYSKYRKMENKLHTKNVITKICNYITSWISDYGTKPLRVFIFIITLIGGFSLLYYVCPFILFKNATSFIDYIYVSGITFFTVGYGDILPLNSITKIAVLIEAFLGVATMSYFLVVLSRKIIR